MVEFFLGKICLMRIFAQKMLRIFSPTDAVWTGCGGVVVWTGWTSGRVFSWRNISRDFLFEFSWTSGRVFSWNDSSDFVCKFSWTSGRVFSWRNISRDFWCEFSRTSGRVFSWRNFSRDFWFEFSWTSGRVFSWRYISEDFDANFPGPVVEFFLDEIFLGFFIRIFLDQW